MSERRWKGAWLEVVTEDVQLPNGRAIELDIVRHPGASAVVPFVSESEVLLILSSAFVMVFNATPLLIQVWFDKLPDLLPAHADNWLSLRIVFPYGSIYFTRSPRHFWSRWSRPAMLLIRRVFYYPLGGSDRFWLSIAVMFFLNASSHYDVSMALFGNRAVGAWNLAFDFSSLFDTPTSRFERPI